jgi:tetratricopeptide (TPR) repeat protein
MTESSPQKQFAKNRKPPAPRKPSPDAGRAMLILAALLAIATLLTYAPVAGNGFITMDDGLYVTANRHVLAGLTAEGLRWAFTSTTTGNWHPLTWISLMADTQFFGSGPAGYHVINLIFHLLNSLLIFFLLHRLTGAAMRSFFVAALFALHPMHVESVAWISERKDVLSTLFWLLGIGAYLRYCRKPSTFKYLAVACTLLLGLMTKPMLVSFPLTLLLLDIWPLRRLSAGNQVLRSIARLAWEKAPLFVIVFLSSLLTVWAQKAASALAPLDQLPASIRAANAIVSYIAYLGKLFWPENLALFYPYRTGLPASWETAACLVVFAGITVLALRAFSSYPFFTFGWFWYAITLIPVIGFVQIGSQGMADRYSYVPSLGLFVLAVWGMAELLSRFGRIHPSLLPWSWAPPALASGIILVLAVLAYRQVQFWKDDIVAWERAVAVTAPNYFAEYNLARSYDSQHRYDEAIAHNRECIRLAPDRGDAYNNLAVLLMSRNNYSEAESALRSALRIHPQFAQAQSNLGVLLGRRQRFDEGFQHHQEAVRLDPQNPEIRRNLAVSHCDFGIALAGKDRLAEAIAAFQSAISVDPQFAQAYYNLGLTRAGLGQTDEAIRAYEKAIAADPNFAEAHNNLGVLLAEKGQAVEAAEHFRAALRIRPDYQDATNNLQTLDSRHPNGGNQR